MSDGLHVLDHLPPGLLECPAEGLHRALPGPTLLELPGRAHQPVFTAVLQHGNEPVGWDAVRRVLRARRGGEPPRPWCIFIGNLAAAGLGMRRFDSQPDFNRCWPGSASTDTGTHRLLSLVTERMRRARPLVSVDIHGNTGRNPHYAVVNNRRDDTLGLAALFSDTALYFTTPSGSQSVAFSAFCCAVTVECGTVGSEDGVARASRFLERCLGLDEVPSLAASGRELSVFVKAARLTVPAHLSLGFGDASADVNFDPELDRLNFRPLAAGTRLATVRRERGPAVMAHNPEGRDVTGAYLDVKGRELVLSAPVMPAMLTRDPLVIRQDCLGYLMESEVA